MKIETNFDLYPDLKIDELDSLAKTVSKSVKIVDTLYVDDTFLDSLN